ncbi:MAG: polyphosphate polymerase domain-containing protein [Bdellovibrionales bacterium]|nr:polyphosphate polymerase domain-containing protein [Bdellovibrionales bacterium]
MAGFRHELKFIVSADECYRLFEDISPYCDPDPHVGEFQTYEIASIYYDTADLRFYYDREESVAYRRKIRLRSYNRGGKVEALFIEIKEKHQQYVFKKRINLRSQRVLELGIPHQQIPLELVLEDLVDCAEARELQYLQRRLQLYPVINIRYHRRPLIPRYEGDMRITFDSRITAGGDDLGCYDPETEKAIISSASGVLEIKTNKAVPIWLQSAMCRYHIAQTRYSKYCLGVDAVYGRAGRGFHPRVQWPAKELETQGTIVENAVIEPPIKIAAGA